MYFFFFFLCVWVKGAGLMLSSAGSGSLQGWISWLVLARVGGQAGLGCRSCPKVGSEVKVLLAQPAAPANLETRLAMAKFCFIPPGKRFDGSSGNANPQVSLFMTGSCCHS